MKAQPLSVEKLLAFWPLIAALGVGVAGYLKMAYRVDELDWKETQRETRLDTMREKRSIELEEIRTRLAILETKEKDHGGRMAH